MFLAVACVILVAAIAGVLRGGSIVRIAEIPLRGLLPLAAAAALQAVVVLVLPRDALSGATWVVFLVSNCLVGACLWLNRKLPGVALAAAGLAMNATVILLNGGMPVSRTAAEIASMRPETARLDAEHVFMDDDTWLAPLGDVVPIPQGHLVVSPGDLLLAAALARFVFKATQAHPRDEYVGHNLEVSVEGGET